MINEEYLTPKNPYNPYKVSPTSSGKYTKQVHLPRKKDLTLTLCGKRPFLHEGLTGNSLLISSKLLEVTCQMCLNTYQNGLTRKQRLKLPKRLEGKIGGMTQKEEWVGELPLGPNEMKCLPEEED